jgi:hypothetical protein
MMRNKDATFPFECAIVFSIIVLMGLMDWIGMTLAGMVVP